ncbi:hypothetical protein MDAP_000092 [Mitosporidium daphniae]
MSSYENILKLNDPDFIDKLRNSALSTFSYYLPRILGVGFAFICLDLAAAIVYFLWRMHQKHEGAEQKDSSDISAALASQGGTVDAIQTVEANATEAGCLPKIDGNSASARHTDFVRIVIASISLLVFELF